MPLKRRLLFCSFLLCLATGSHEAFAQNINGEKIQVAAEALTVLKFNSEIKRYELGDRTGYTCQVRDNDNSLVIKTLKDNPQGTNLLVTEGKRTHYFIVSFLPKIDLNNTKLYYDYSDLKALRRLIESAPVVASNNPPPAAEPAPAEEKISAKEKRRKEKEQEKALEEERKKQEALEQERIAAQKKEAEKAKLLAQQEQAKKDAEKKEQERIAAEKKKAEEERLAKIERDKQEQLAKKQEQLAKEQERIQKEKEKQAQIAAAKEEARKKKEAEEAARIQKIKDEREAAIAKKKEDDRLAAERKKQLAEEQERKRIEAENEKKLAALKEQQRKEDEKQQKLAKLAEEKRLKEEAAEAKKQAELAKKQAEKDALEAKTSYTQAELWKKYPNIVFGDPPDGQHMTGEYYVPADTAENYRVSQLLLAMPPWLSATSDTVAGVSLTLQSMLFSGVNCYMRFTIHNKSKKDFLIGNMNLEWHKEGKGLTNLFPCYVNGYNVVLPGKDYTLIYASRAVNATDADHFEFTLVDRFQKIGLRIPIAAKDYNIEMVR